MTCREIEAILDELVAGDRMLAGELDTHLSSCPRCQASLARARQIEALLAERPPAAPVTFSASVLRRVRREAWQAEQMVDRFFNAILVAGAVLVGVGIWMIANVTGLAGLFRRAVDALVQGGWTAVAQKNPHAWAYLLSIALLVTGASTWWWIERGTADE